MAANGSKPFAAQFFLWGGTMKSKQDLWFEIKVSIFLLALAVIYVILTLVGIETEGRFYAAGKLKSTTFPYFIGILFMASSAYLLIKSVFQYNRAIKQEKETKGLAVPEEAKRPFPWPLKESILPFGAFAVYIAVLRQIGFLVATILLSLSMLFYLNRKNWLRNIIFSIVFPLAVYLLFVKVLNIRLPVGILFGGH
jgi:putative tricarboxylic transport membrane protein